MEHNADSKRTSRLKQAIEKQLKELEEIVKDSTVPDTIEVWEHLAGVPNIIGVWENLSEYLEDSISQTSCDIDLIREKRSKYEKLLWKMGHQQGKRISFP